MSHSRGPGRGVARISEGGSRYSRRVKRDPPGNFSKFHAATLLDINTGLWGNDIKASFVFLNCEKYKLTANIEL